MRAVIEELRLDRPELIVGLCEPGEDDASEAPCGLDLDRWAADAEVVRQFAELRRAAEPGARTAHRRAE